MIRFVMSRLPYSWVEHIDFFVHKVPIPRVLWQSICDEYERRIGVPEEVLEDDRRRRQQQQRKWWEH